MDKSQDTDAIAWHSFEVEEVINRLGTDPQKGLMPEEAGQRLDRFGKNLLRSRPPRPAWLRFFLQFHNILIYVMLAAAVITAMLGHLIDTAVLMTAVLVNACVGFIQEGKAEDALKAIRGMLTLRTTVLRNGKRIEVEAETLVPGDIVVLASGDKVPADLRLLSQRGLRVNEAMLTGESEAVEKTSAPVDEDAPLGDRRCLLYSGTLIVSGKATGVVVETGTHTELGRISSMLEHIHTVTTPLLRQMNVFSRWLAIAIIFISVLTFVVGVLWREHPPREMFMLVVALAASAMPEGLPAILTITLAFGVRRMAQHRAIIRHLPAVEALGSVTIICSDKTGTLTRNEMTVQRVAAGDKIFDVTGVGYLPAGDFFIDGRQVPTRRYPELAEIAAAAAICNDAELHLREGEWRMEGDPTEGALLAFAVKAGMAPTLVREEFPRVDAIPFESEHRIMASLNRNAQNEGFITVKGAPERILEMCGLEAADADYWHRCGTEFAGAGLRLLAIARKPADETQQDVRFADVEGGFAMLALVGIIDPPREEAVEAVAQCYSAGIKVKMITGDHVDTARAIGAQLGIGLNGRALTGAEIEDLNDEALRQAVPEIDVFARASPEHKLRLVQAFQDDGEVVAMTGDGVNDAPALKRADIGVAMGMKGTEAAKEAADMVLADDNFATIARAVREGRGIYDNIRKFVLFMLPTNGGEALVVIAAILFELVLPLTPAQVLWINMATSSTLGLALAFERPERDVMRRPPRDPKERLLSGFFIWRICMVSVLMMTAALGLFHLQLSQGADLETARTTAVSAVVMAEMFYLLNSRYIYHPVLSREGLFGNRYVWIAIAVCAALQLAFVYAPPLQAVFDSAPLTPIDVLQVLFAGLMVFAVAEIEKAVIHVIRQRAKHPSVLR
jgi:magnesium-transporting ATPase (P-type)